MRKSHFQLRFRVNLAAHDHAHTTVLIHLIDPPEPMDTLVFRNDHPGEFPWNWEFRTHMRIAAVGVEVFVRKHTNGGRPTVWVEADCKEYHRQRRLRTEKNGLLLYREIFTAEDTPPL